MASTALQNLQAAIQASAAQGPFALDAAYLTAGLADPNVRIPDSYDSDLTAAFQVAAAGAFQVSAAPADVGPVAGDQFLVRRASLPFIGVALQGTGTLTFSLADGGKLLVVQIESRPAGWTWTTSFPAMIDWIFTALPVTAAAFVFSSQDGPTQAAAISCGVPAAARPLFALFDPVINAPPSLELRGALDLASYDGETILLPAGTLRGTLSDASFKLLYLEVIAPAIALTIPPPPNPGGPLITDTQQTPQLAIAADLRLDGAPSAYTLQVAIAALAPGAVPFSISLRAGATGPQLTPATMLALAGGSQSGGQSYLTAVPPVLQQFLTSVSLRGLALAGTIAVPPAISAIGLEIGSVPGMAWSPIPDAPTGLDFTFTSFALAWSLLNPFTAATRQQTFLFSTQFTLAPAIFKGKTPGTDGVFTVTFDSSLQFTASFAGTALLRDFVDVLSGGAVTLPDGVDASLSDITVEVDSPNRGFSFTSGFDVELSFLEVGGKPILAISDGRVSLGAMTPTQTGGGPTTTAWQAGIAGTLAIGPVGANVSVTYDGFQTPARWLLAAQLAQPVDIEAVVQQFFDPFGSYDFPDFLPGTLTLKTFAIAAQLASKGGQPPTTYAIDTTFSWLFDLGDQQVGIDPAHLMLSYDGAKPAGQQFSGLAEGTWVYTAINLELTMGYQFVPTAQGSNQTLYVQWEGFRASYETGKEQLTFSLRGWTVGTLIQALVRTLGDPYFTLPSPWDLLNEISLDGLSLIVSLKSGVKNRLSAAYTLASPINLGFILIKGLIFRRDTDGKVTIAIDGTVPAPLQGTMGNLLDPSKGQDVRDMPPVPGAGEAYFKLFLLALGQRIGITGHQSFKTTQEAIRALEGVPSTITKQNPVNPTANQGATTGIPYYEPANNWLVAGHLGLLQIAGVWTVDAMVVFNDPELYGLRLALAGPRAGGLAGLAVDILYKKITDDVGVFQIEFTFPDSIRNLNFGAVSIVLPQIGVQVYTNGDFLIDIGFPYNNDFRRSFSISAIVYGVPVLGSGGLYFGKLSNATATQVPRTQLGTFDPVIVFGVGLQLGLGYNFIKGPLQAGFALTVFGIIEGVIAAWHPYTPALPAGGALSLQDEYYFKISGTVGIIGLLYGKIDFAIIQASLNVNITLALKITYESFRAIPIVASAKVDVSLKVKIDLGLFSITISLSFATTVSATFVIGEDRTAPWDDARSFAHARRRALLTEGPAAIRARAGRLQPRPRRRLAADVRAATKPRLRLVAAPQYTVLAPEGATDPAKQDGAFVFLMAMDAPAADSATPDPGTTSFGALCGAYFPWLIETLGGDPASVTRAELEAFVARLADNDAPVTTTGDLLGFLADHVILDIATTAPSAERARAAMAAGAVLFPVFDGLALSVPDPSGGAARPIPFETYATATSGYRATVAKTFAEVEVQIASEASAPRARAVQDDPESMAALVFGDTFSIIGRQLLQAALDALDAYVYRLSNTPAAPDSIAWILAWANARGNQLVPDDVALSNQDHALTVARALTIAGLTATLQAGDTLRTVAARFSDPALPARWTTAPSALVIGNADARVLQAGVTMALKNGKDERVDYVTTPGDSFAAIARSLEIALAALAAEDALLDAERLLIPARSLAIPALAYTTGAGDTLRSVAARFAITVPALAADNLAVDGLFALDAEDGVITLANLAALPVADLWPAIQATDQVAQTAGMVSRFLMFGLRLPADTGLTLSDKFLYPPAQAEYGLYQLTGQQFPVPATLGTGGSYAIAVERGDISHGVALDFIELNGTTDKRAALDLTAAWGLLDLVATWARSGAFQPAPSFAALPLAATAIRTIALSSPALWSTSDRAGLSRVTDRGAGPGNALAQPTWWSLPAGLVAETAARQAALAPVFPALTDLMPRMPRFLPARVASSATGADSTAAPLTNFAWATRIDVQIKRLPAQSVADAQPQGDGSVPSGPALAAALPNVYELVAPASDAGAQLVSLMRGLAALGPELASGAFLLYSQATGAAAGSGDAIELITLADREFLAFVTQTNLSTDANPEGAARAVRAPDAEPPHGVANAPAELVRLLWELSVVRSGGYYLYYRVLDGDAGLPPALFDASGSATVSFVITLAAQGAASPGASVLDFVNGFVTTDDLDRTRDIVELGAAPGQTTTAALPAGARLSGLAATYGVAPGQLATANPDASVTPGVVLPIAGLVRQLGPADVIDPSITLATLARYYSQGAEQPITAAQIAQINPGVAVALGAVFYIPALRYVVATTAAPGATLGAIAAYYGISLDALAVMAREVDGLIAAGSVLALDTQGLEPRTTLGPANLGVALERANLGAPALPPNPTEPDKIAFAEASMYALYNTLSAGYAVNPYFRASPLGLPFGPQTDPGAPAASSVGPEPAHPLRAAAHRRARLAAAAEADFTYSQLLGLGEFAAVNAAIDLPAAPSADSPYVGVGTPAQIALRWQDLFGNTTVTPFSSVPAGYTGAINGEAVRIRYSDALIGPAGWPQALMFYTYAGDPAAATVDLAFQLDTKAYVGQPDQAARDLALYRRVYYQLHQDYRGKGVPEVTGNAVTMQVANALLATPLRTLDDDEADVIRGFVADCVTYLAALVAGRTPPAQPIATLSLPVATAAIAAGSLIALDLTLTFVRNPVLVDPATAALPGGLTATGPVLPRPDAGATIAYTGFARDFEAIFTTSTWQLRIGEGLRAQPGVSGGASNRQLWAVRFGAGGIAFEIGDDASYYAPRPIARSLVNRTATIVQYPGGDEVTSSFTAADQNLWFQTALDAVDSFLSGPGSTSVFALDQLLGTADPIADGYLGKVLAAKQSLADSISATSAPILSTGSDDASTAWAAQTALRQQLLAQLGPAYAAGATVVYGVDAVTGGTGALPPRLYGQPTGTLAAGAINQDYALTSARLPLGPTTADGETYDPRLAFVMTTRNVAEQAYVALDLRYPISHLEFARTAVPGVDGYVESRWLAFVTGPIDCALGASTANIPVVNRALPVPPTMTLQTGDKLYAAPATAGELPLWSYRFEYQADQAAQDAVRTTIELNVPLGTASAARATGPDLFTALAQLVSTYPAVAADLARSLPAIGAGTADEATIQLARQAVQAFQLQITAIAEAHAASVPRGAAAAVASAPSRIELAMSTRLDRGDDDTAMTEILDLQIDGVAAIWDRDARTISNGTIVLPEVRIEIAPETYELEPVTVLPPNVVIAYRYRASDGSYLSFDAARGIASRGVALRGLNVLVHQNAWSALEVQRNRILTPIADVGRIHTREDFVFQTPTVRFANPMVPRLEHATFSLDGVAPAGAPIGDVLDAFYAALFGGGDGAIATSVTMTGAYSYRVIPDAPRTVLPIAMVPPSDTPVTPTPPPSFVAPFAQLLDDWIAAKAPTQQGEPQLNFTATLFAAIGAQQPVLVVHDLPRTVQPTGTPRDGRR